MLITTSVAAPRIRKCPSLASSASHPQPRYPSQHPHGSFGDPPPNPRLSTEPRRSLTRPYRSIPRPLSAQQSSLHTPAALPFYLGPAAPPHRPLQRHHLHLHLPLHRPRVCACRSTSERQLPRLSRTHSHTASRTLASRLKSSVGDTGPLFLASSTDALSRAAPGLRPSTLPHAPVR